LPTGDDERRVMELERKIGQLTMENDFLKKALQHFKDHHPPAVVNGGDACLKKSSKPRRKARPVKALCQMTGVNRLLPLASAASGYTGGDGNPR